VNQNQLHLLIAALRKLNGALETAAAGEDGRPYAVAGDEIDALEQELFPQIGLPEHGKLWDAK